MELNDFADWSHEEYKALLGFKINDTSIVSLG